MSIILLIADDAPARSTISSALGQVGHFDWEVGSAAAARRHLSQWTPDLIINAHAHPFAVVFDAEENCRALR